MRLARQWLFIILSTGGASSPVLAQEPWSVFVAGAAVGFGGGSEALDPPPGEPTQYKPTPTIRLHLGLTREFGRGGITFDASYGKSGLGGYHGTINFSITPALTVYDLRLLASYSIAAIGQGTLRLGAGPMLQIWSGNAVSDTQGRMGAATALTAAVPISRRVGVLISASLGVAASPFDPQTLEANALQAVTTWTRELGVGARFSW